ncbi:MAG: hypothetical protein HWE21_10950 [Cytophagia bacterium]|nr:hypothetical protein [Cytophagia bacterium]
MPKYKYKVTAEATSNIEWAKISLEGEKVYLKPNPSKTKFQSTEREIEVDGKVDIFCKCKGDTGIEVKYTVTHVNNQTKILNEKKVTIGANGSPARIGKWSGDANPV